MNLTPGNTSAENRAAITTSRELSATLQKMVDVLQGERQALAGLDIDGIVGAAWTKSALVEELGGTQGSAIDDECRGLLEAAKHLNEVNRQLRNLIAANVAARLDALTGSPSVYRTRPVGGPAYAYAGARG